MKVEYPGIPMFIYGHSMGGMIAVSTVMRCSLFSWNWLSVKQNSIPGTQHSSKECWKQ